MKNKIIPITLIIVGLSLIGINGVSKVSNIETSIEVDTADKINIQSSILASGQMAYKKQVELRSEILGRVIEVLVEESNIVKKGDVVLRIDPKQLKIQVDQAQAIVRQNEISIERQKVAVAQMKRKLKRQESLYKSGLIDEETFEDKSTALKFSTYDLQEKQETLVQYQAQLAQAKENLDKTIFRSPINGIVIKVDVKEGESVIAGSTNIPGSSLITIADTSEVLTEIHVDETDIAKVAVGQKANIYAVAFPGTPFTGTVRSIATTVTNSKRGRGLGFVVKVLLDDVKNRVVLPGISCRAEVFFASQIDTLAVPIKAILFENTQGQLAKDSYIFVENNGIAEKRRVQLGVSDDDNQEVISGLSVGENIIIGPYRKIQTLKDGSEVTPIKNEAS
ncbi:MAG: efflux RND transporter periplasmic adaptor subunit [Colwellia sp.]|nr:efflux RND transporter periplasmic adaptor subunit [Colwellia sp.]